jgi:hypothetical protein
MSIANRGSQSGGPSPLYDFTHSDAMLAANLEPECDASAFTYYNAVVSWLQAPANGISGSVNIVETGHSLGGEEADYVEARLTNAPDVVTYATRAVTFNALGFTGLALGAPAGAAVGALGFGGWATTSASPGATLA